MGRSTVDKDGAWVEAAGGGGGDVYLANANTFTAHQTIASSGSDHYLLIQRNNNAQDVYLALSPTGAYTTSNVAWNFEIPGGSNDFAFAYWDGSGLKIPFRMNNTGHLILDSDGTSAYCLKIAPTSGHASFGVTRPANDQQAYFALNPAGAYTTSNVSWSFGLLANSNDFNIQAWNGSATLPYLNITNAGVATFYNVTTSAGITNMFTLTALGSGANGDGGSHPD